MPRPTKTFAQHIHGAVGNFVDIDAYEECPASAFLKYTLEARDAEAHCNRHFPTNNVGDFTSASSDSIQLLRVALLPAIMGHFETFQRQLFAGAFEYSVYLDDFNLENFLRNLKKLSASNTSIDVRRLAAYREQESMWVGMLLADQVKGWHNPERVNELFSAFSLNFQFYSAQQIRELNVLWQLRHSIAHTGGTLSIGDAAKVSELNDLGGTNLAFSRTMIAEVSRKFHSIVARSVNRLQNKYVGELRSDIPFEDREEIEKFFSVNSSYKAWLP